MQPANYTNKIEYYELDFLILFSFVTFDCIRNIREIEKPRAETTHTARSPDSGCWPLGLENLAFSENSTDPFNGVTDRHSPEISTNCDGNLHVLW